MYQGIENVELEIKYSDYWKNSKGEMCIHLYEFMGMHNITKFKKLMKIIRQSNTPDEEKKIKKWCEQIIEQVEPFVKCTTLQKCEQEEQIRKLETEIELVQYNRDKYKRNTPPYKDWSKRLKDKKKDLSMVKQKYKKSIQDIKNASHDKSFCKTCLETIG